MNDTTAAAQAEVNNKKKGRLYVVRNIVNDSVRLVMAGNAAAASRHVAKDTLDVSIPSNSEVLNISKLYPNIEIEQA